MGDKMKMGHLLPHMASRITPHESLLEQSASDAQEGHALRSTGKVRAEAQSGEDLPPAFVRVAPEPFFPKSLLLYHDDRMDHPTAPSSLIELVAEVSVEAHPSVEPASVQPALPSHLEKPAPRAAQPAAKQTAMPSAGDLSSGELAARLAAELAAEDGSPEAPVASRAAAAAKVAEKAQVASERHFRNASRVTLPATSLLSEQARVKETPGEEVAATETTPAKVIAVDPGAMETKVPDPSPLIDEGDTGETAKSISSVVTLLYTAVLILFFQ